MSLLELYDVIGGLPCKMLDFSPPNYLNIRHERSFRTHSLIQSNDEHTSPLTTQHY